VRVTVVLPFPADVRSVPADRFVLQPSSVEVALPLATLLATLQEGAAVAGGAGAVSAAASADAVSDAAVSAAARVRPPHIDFAACLRLARWTRVRVTVEGLRADVAGRGLSPLAASLSKLSVAAQPDTAVASSSGGVTSLSMALHSASLSVTGGQHGPRDVLSLGTTEVALGLGVREVGGGSSSPGASEACVEVGCSVLIGPVEGAFSRCALCAVAALAALGPKPSERPSAISTAAPAPPLALPRFEVDVSVELPGLRVAAIMGGIAAGLDEACPPDEANPLTAPDLALLVEGATAKARGSGGGSSGAPLVLASCGASVERVAVEQGAPGAAVAACIEVADIVADGVRVPSGEVKPSVRVREFYGAWSPGVVRCIGALLGTAARDLQDLLFPEGPPRGPGPAHPCVLERRDAPLDPKTVESLLKLGARAAAKHLRYSLVVVKCDVVTVDFPFQLVDGAPAAGSGDGDLLCVRVDGATLLVAPTPAGDPSIVLHMANTELLGSGIAATAPARSQRTPPPSILKPPRARELQRFLAVEAFALESFADRVVELCIKGVRGQWSPAAQLRVIKAARDVTRSVWEALLACVAHFLFFFLLLRLLVAHLECLHLTSALFMCVHAPPSVQSGTACSSTPTAGQCSC